MKLKVTPPQVQKIELKKEFKLKQLMESECLGMAGDFIEIIKLNENI